jgi:Heterokaryon incompatibility protein (HET)
MSVITVSYEYTKLQHHDDIRLLTLLPARPGDSLKCQISHHSLSGTPSYEALSYVWGPQNDPADLYCEGQVLQVGPNLHAALSRLRRTNRERILWVDKICICQEDIDERGHQVSLMSEIYSTAVSVIVWLGEVKGSNAAFALLERLDKIISKQRTSKTRLSLPSSQRGFQLSRASVQELSALKALLNNTWFERAWTFQEAIFAKSALFVCGAQSISWEALAQCLACILERQTVHEKHLEHAAVISSSAKLFLDMVDTKGRFTSDRLAKDDGTGTGAQKSVHELLVIRRSAAATDARDKVFALINASSDKIDISRHRHYTWIDRPSFSFHEPDYHMTVAQVFTAAARHAIAVEKKLDILLSVEVPKPDPTLPSWVPDWREPLTKAAGQPGQSDMRDGFSAAQDSSVELQDHFHTRLREHEGSVIVNHPWKLTVKGLRFVKITTVSDRCPPLDSPHLGSIIGDQGRWSNMARIGSMKGIYTPTGEDVQLAYTRTRSCYQRQPLSTTKRTTTTTTTPQPDPMPIAPLNDGPTEWHMNCGQRKFYTTEDGYIGLGPVTTRAKDLIYLLLGGDVPFILRPATADTMTLVGPAYVHGLMQGEGFQKMRKKHNLEGKNWHLPFTESEGEGFQKMWKKYNLEEKNWQLPSLEWVTLI